jgi:hypothetical protein
MTFNTNIKARVLGLVFSALLVLGLLQPALSNAQVMTTTTTVSAKLCLSLQSNLRYGVTALQNFLVSQGYFNSAYLGSGRFGALTLRAVIQYQAAENLPNTGFVGALTRATVASRSCGTTTTPPTSNLSAYSLSPSSGAVGTTVTITGIGFTATGNTVLMDGSVAAQNVSYSPCPIGAQCFVAPHDTITFTIPSSLSPNCPTGSMCAMYMRQVTPATYKITVQNSNGTSNSVSFTVTGDTTATPVTIYSESPTSGVVGTTVSLTGFGFTSDNTVLMDGSVAAKNVPITSSIAIACTTNPSCHGGINQTISFTIPSSLAPYCAPGNACAQYMRLVTPATYKISVLNSNGTSNTVSYTVTDSGTSNQSLTISGLDAPASLALGQSGTWTVRTVSSGAGTLHYSVTWGDEAGAVTSAFAQPQGHSIQSSSTFTHTYAHSGNYTATFTVTDDFGHTVSSSNTVVVTPLY